MNLHNVNFKKQYIKRDLLGKPKQSLLCQHHLNLSSEIHAISSKSSSLSISTIGSLYPPLYSVMGTSVLAYSAYAIFNSSVFKVVLGAISSNNRILVSSNFAKSTTYMSLAYLGDIVTMYEPNHESPMLKRTCLGIKSILPSQFGDVQINPSSAFSGNSSLILKSTGTSLPFLPKYACRFSG